jgi:ribose transport system substrate-binding protein
MDHKTYSRRQILKTGAVAATAASIIPAFGLSNISTAGASVRVADTSKPLLTAFCWYLNLPGTVAWSQGIQQVTSVQETVSVKYSVKDPNSDPTVQVQMVNTMVDQGYDIIWLQPIDSAAIAAPVKRARDAGIVVITINIVANSQDAAFVTQNHSLLSHAVGVQMAKALNGTGNIYLVTNAPGTSIYNLRKNGFLSALKGTNIKVLGEANGQGTSVGALDAFVPVLRGNSKIDGVWCLNDDMALGVIQALKEAKRTALVWADGDGSQEAMDAIRAGTLAGDTYTDLIAQGNMAATAGLAFAQSGLPANKFPLQAEIDVPFTVVTKANVSTIPHLPY